MLELEPRDRRAIRHADCALWSCASFRFGLKADAGNSVTKVGPRSFTPGSSRQQAKPGARPKAEVSRSLRMFAALGAQQNFEPFRLTEACDELPYQRCRHRRHRRSTDVVVISSHGSRHSSFKKWNGSAAKGLFLNNRILLVICPTSQMCVRDRAGRRPAGSVAGYCAWGCFRYFAARAVRGLGLPGRSARPSGGAPLSAAFSIRFPVYLRLCSLKARQSRPSPSGEVVTFKPGSYAPCRANAPSPLA